jgi:hypothetical protein
LGLAPTSTPEACATTSPRKLWVGSPGGSASNCASNCSGRGRNQQEAKRVHGTLKFEFQSSVPVPPLAPFFHHPLLAFLRSLFPSSPPRRSPSAFRSAASGPSAELQPTKPLGSFLPLSPHAESPLCCLPSAFPPRAALLPCAPPQLCCHVPHRSSAAMCPTAALLPCAPPQLCCHVPHRSSAAVSPSTLRPSSRSCSVSSLLIYPDRSKITPQFRPGSPEFIRFRTALSPCQNSCTQCLCLLYSR